MNTLNFEINSVPQDIEQCLKLAQHLRDLWGDDNMTVIVGFEIEYSIHVRKINYIGGIYGNLVDAMQNFAYGYTMGCLDHK